MGAKSVVKIEVKSLNIEQMKNLKALTMGLQEAIT